MSELLPCPFCGGEAKRNDDLQNWGDIFCADCGCHMLGKDGDWNTRQQGWVSVEDRLPEHPDKVIIFIPNYVTHATYMDGEWLQCGRDISDSDITHWMPLPSPPIGE